MKDFITKNADTHRKAFARRAVTVPRQSILIGTTNDQEYLKDPTGGRRFWPVRVGQVDFKALIRDRDQLWAEAKMCYQLGELLYLDNPKVKAIAESEQYDRAIVDELETKVLIILNSLHMLNEIDFETFFTELCFKYNLKETDYYLQVRCKKIFTKLQYKKIRVRKEGVRHYTWVKKETGHKSYNGVRL
jgi:putative DNA primase/helicase